MGLGKLGDGRPETSEPARLLQELIDVDFLVDVPSGGEQHQSYLALRRQVGAVPVAGELPGSREETPEQGNPIDVGGGKLVPEPRVPEPKVPSSCPTMNAKASLFFS